MTPPPTATDLPPSSLIICSRNRPHLLLDTVASVLACDVRPRELIVIDQSTVPHPTLASCEIHDDCVLRYLWADSVGASRARNAGIVAAAYDLLAFTDDDILVTAGWYDLLVRTLITVGQHGVVTGRVETTAVETAGGFAPSTIHGELPAVYAGRVGKDVLFTGNMALYRTAFDIAGLFDERLGPGTPFRGAEDNDLGFRLLEAGYRITYVPDAVVYHRAWRSSQQYVSLYWGYGRGQGAYYAKHVRWRDRYMVHRMGRELLAYVFACGSKLLRGRPQQACGDLAAALGLLVGFAAWIATAHRPIASIGKM